MPTWAGLKEFGEVVTADHFDCRSDSRNSVMGHKWGVVMLDLHSGFIMARAAINKSGCETNAKLRAWRGRDRILHMHSDGSGELENVCNYEGMTHSTIETGDHAANGVAEGHIQIAKLGAATLLTQAG